MASELKTTVTELPQSRVRVEVEVAAEEVARATQATASRIGRELKLAGFRQGKVPAAVVIARMGREAVVDDAVLFDGDVAGVRVEPTAALPGLRRTGCLRSPRSDS